jgi:hypothetical protein
MTLRAQVRNGRLELSEPTELAEGDIFELVPAIESFNDVDDLPDLADEQRTWLRARLARARAEVAAGEYVTLEEWQAKRAARPR